MVIDERAYLIIDLLVITALLFFIIKGVINGFLYELINVMFLFVAIIAAWIISPICATKFPIFDINTANELLDLIVDVSNINIIVNNILWFLILILCILVIFIVIKPLLKKFCKFPILGSFNRIFGGVLGLIYGFILVLLFTVFLSLPVFQNGKQAIDNTVLKYTNPATNFVTKVILKNANISSIKDATHSFNADKARQDLYDLLVKQGILDE